MKILTFGELMLRLKTPEHLKILQADTFEASYGGAEANVAVSLATLGNDVSYVTKVPEHQVGQAAINEIRRFGVDTTRVLRGGGRALPAQERRCGAEQSEFEEVTSIHGMAPSLQDEVVKLGSREAWMSL